MAAGFDGAAAAAVAVSNSFLNESDREVKAEPREPSSTQNSGNSQHQQTTEAPQSSKVHVFLEYYQDAFPLQFIQNKGSISCFLDWLHHQKITQ